MIMYIQVGPRSCWLLRTHWMRLTMATRAGGYYGAASKGAQGVTHGYPLYPTILNVVVNAVVMHWVTVILEGAE